MVPMSRPITARVLAAGGSSAGDTRRDGCWLRAADRASEACWCSWPSPPIVWVGFAPSAQSEHVAALKSPSATPVVDTRRQSPTPKLTCSRPDGAHAADGLEQLERRRLHRADRRRSSNRRRTTSSPRASRNSATSTSWSTTAGRAAALRPASCIPDPTRFPERDEGRSPTTCTRSASSSASTRCPGSQTCGNYFSQYPIHGHRQPRAREAGCRACSPAGASTTSSTTGAAPTSTTTSPSRPPIERWSRTCRRRVATSCSRCPTTACRSRGCGRRDRQPVAHHPRHPPALVVGACSTSTRRCR